VTPPTVLLLAGEASGDLYGADVAAALRARVPGIRIVGMGGPCMAAEGVELLAELDDLAVMGFGEIVRHLEFFRALERRMREWVLRADLVIPIDYPGFNMRIARAAREAGRPVVYYISPKVWAWRASRAKRLAEDVDHVAVIFPFEVDILEKAGARATFVGNPLLDRPNDVDGFAIFHERWGLDATRPILAVLPGSRHQELERHLQPFLRAAALVAEAVPDVQTVVAKAPTLPASAYAGLGVPVVEDTRALLRHSRASLVKSGTSTLEATLEETPFVVAYRTSAFSWAIVRRVLKIEHVSLTNLVAGEEVVPEFIQEAMIPEHLAERLIPLLDLGSAARQRQVIGLAKIRSLLGSPGASARVAELGLRLMEARS
jgi:lipid-A-disaccharide synthase